MRGRRSIAALFVVAAGCTGVIGDAIDIVPPDTKVQCTTLDSPGAPVPMRRLTAPQVTRSTAAILGAAGANTVPDETLFTFHSNVSSSVDFVGARGYLDFAEATVATVDLSNCSAADATCEQWLFDEMGAQLFRRPLSSEERIRYQSLFDAGSAAADQAANGSLEGARWVLESMLQSPTFLYMDEVTKADGYLDDYSIAARLALTLWGSNPDALLLQKAAAGELSTPEQVSAEAERMLDDPRSVGGLTDFVDQWLHLGRLDDPDARPDLEALGSETLDAMRAEPVQLFQMLLQQGGDMKTLLTTHQTSASPALAAIYGDDLVSDAGDHYELDPQRRAGVLSMPGVMAALAHADATSPTLRGFNVLKNFLCNPPGPPPAGVAVTLPDIGPDKTTRERLEAHFSDPSCSSCHALMDGIGFAFEGIDWLGRSRDEEFGKPIDDTTTFPLDDKEVTVDGAVDLANALGDSPDIAQCLARQWTSYGAGMPDKKEADCLIEHMAGQAQQEAGLRAMILSFVVSDWYRRGPGEVQ